MYGDYDNTHNTYHAQRAYEIDLRVREMEKKYALMSYINSPHAGDGFFTSVKKTARRLAGLVSGLFVA